MNFSKKQKIIIWVSVIWIIFLLGLKIVRTPTHPAPAKEVWENSSIELYFYGFRLLTKITIGITLEGEPKSGTVWQGKAFLFLVYLGDYKYQLIAATLLIGLAGIITSGKKGKKNNECP